jgi:NAD(P)H dehydrogenase (quinone)
MSLAIFGATGQLGGLTIDSLLKRGAEPGKILALGRNIKRLSELADHGLRTAQIDLDDVVGTTATLAGVDTVLLISIKEPGRRIPQHANAINAARTAGVRHIVYTSGLQAPTTILELAADHKATEELITASGIPATFLRNGWYTENHLQDFSAARQSGVIANSVGEGRIATAPRRDFAEAAAVVLTTPGHEGKAYELSGDTAWNFTEFAAAAQKVLGTPVRYEALTAEQEHERLISFGMHEATAAFFRTLNANMRDGAMAPTPGDLSRLIGRPTETLIQTMRSWV